MSISFASVYLKTRNFFSIPDDNPPLLQAQYRSFSRQVPLLYSILVINTWVVVWDFWDVAPAWLGRWYPALLTFICGVRLVLWWRSAGHVPTNRAAAKGLRRTNWLAWGLTVAFQAWIFALFPYGDPYGKSLAAFCMAITIVACIVCLMYLRSAAVGVALIGNAAFVVFFGLSDNSEFESMAIIVGLASAALVAMLIMHNREFVRMVASQVKTLRLSNENFRLANHDALTDLPNRREFFAHLDEKLRQAQMQPQRIAVGIIDLDGFKPINDLYGHSSGDALLAEVGQRLTSFDGGRDFHFSRIGGDEFAFIVANADDEELLAIGDQICALLGEPFPLVNATVQITASIGFAVYPDLADCARALFDRADYALYQSKRVRRGGPSLFSADHDAEIYRNSKIEQGLLAADLKKEMAVVFQPIVDMNTNQTIAFEALARWTSPILGQVPPDQFIPVAERIGVVNGLTSVLLEKALTAALRWPSNIRLSFNLSALDICNSGGIVRLVAIIMRSGFDPRRIDFEITETAMIQDFEQACAGINALKALGCGISLDDFGTGFGSLIQLHSLPLTKIKIDRTFVSGLDQELASYKIIKSLLALSRDMGLGCIVEGVETDAEMNALRTLGCSVAQGYRFSRPLSEEAALAFVSEPNPTVGQNAEDAEVMHRDNAADGRLASSP